MRGVVQVNLLLKVPNQRKLSCTLRVVTYFRNVGVVAKPSTTLAQGVTPELSIDGTKKHHDVELATEPVHGEELLPADSMYSRLSRLAVCGF